MESIKDMELNACLSLIDFFLHKSIMSEYSVNLHCMTNEMDFNRRQMPTHLISK